MPPAEPAPGAAPRVAIVDCGGANIASLIHALERLGAHAELTRSPAAIRSAARVILPGVGAAPVAMRRLREAGLAALLPTLRQPVLGICLGMQLLFEATAEGSTPGLGILPGPVLRLAPAPGLPVPHMGWSPLQQLEPDPLLEGIAAGEHVYFVHSYAAAPGAHTIARVAHGAPLAAAVRRGNFCGTQFHPERSGAPGARLLANFLALQPGN